MFLSSFCFFSGGGVPSPRIPPASFSERASLSCLAQLIGTTPAWRGENMISSIRCSVNILLFFCGACRPLGTGGPFLPRPAHRSNSCLVFVCEKINIQLKGRTSLASPNSSELFLPGLFVCEAKKNESASLSCLAQVIGTIPAWSVC